MAMVVPATPSPVEAVRLGSVVVNKRSEPPPNAPPRVFKLPPGYVLMQTPSGTIITKAAPENPGCSQGSGTGGVASPPRFIALKAIPAASNSGSKTALRSPDSVKPSERATQSAASTAVKGESASPRIVTVRTISSRSLMDSGPLSQTQKTLLPQNQPTTNKAGPGVRPAPRIISLKSVATLPSKELKLSLKNQEPVVQLSKSTVPLVRGTVSAGVVSSPRILSVQTTAKPASKEPGLSLRDRAPLMQCNDSQEPAVADIVSTNMRPAPRIITLKPHTEPSSKTSIKIKESSDQRIQKCEMQKTPSSVETSILPNVSEASNVSSSENPKPKPTPWCRDPRPLWKKEPVVLYSGCPPENLIPRRKKKGAPPESLPCPKLLNDILPPGFNYHISSFEQLKNQDNFKAELRINIFQKEDALKWLQEFEDISGTNFRVAKTFTENSSRLIFKKVWKCQRNTHRKDQIMKRESKRHIGCQARIIITVKNKEMKSSTDMLLSDFPCVVGIFHNHCHSTKTPDSLRYRRPLPEIRAKFADMYKAKITPSTALRVHMADLKREHGDKYPEVIQDGARCPPLPWCYRLYYETLGKKVKDGKNKSGRKSSYKRKVVSQPGTSSQILKGNAPVLINFNSGSMNGTSVANKPACDEMQRSINSLYEYEFMSKTKEHDLVESVVVVNTDEDNCELVDGNEPVVTCELIDNNEMVENCDRNEPVVTCELIDNNEMVENCELVDDETAENCELVDGETAENCELVDNNETVESSELLDNNELLDDVETQEDFVEDHTFLDHGEDADEVRSQSVSPQHDVIENNGETITVAVSDVQNLGNSSEPHYSAMEVERVAECFQRAVDDIKVKLQTMPETYLEVVGKFLSAYEEAQQTDSHSTFTKSLSELSSDLCKVMIPKPVSLEPEVSNIVECILDQNQSSSPPPKQLSGSPKRKVLVLRMNPNKFNQIIRKVGGSKQSKELINI